MEITLDNARKLLTEALLLDGKEPGQHVEALRTQFRRQVMGKPDRAEEHRTSKPKRKRKPATKCLPLAERSDNDVKQAFNNVITGMRRSALRNTHPAFADGKPNPKLEKSLAILTAELKRRGLWLD